jgi:predicted small metal-binding protein
MARKYVDCREYPSDMHCSIAISADNEDELLEAAVQHAVAVHDEEDSPELRREIRKLFKDSGRVAA